MKTTLILFFVSYSFMMMAQTSNTEGQEKQIRREKPTSTVGSSSATAPQHTEKIAASFFRMEQTPGRSNSRQR